MSPKIRFASALVVLAALSCGSLGALPLGPRGILQESYQGGFFAAVAKWVVSLFTPEHHVHRGQGSAQTKAGSQMDPNGGPW